jgi:uncharacterized protein (DUF305 family)
MKNNNYRIFFIMLAISFITMYSAMYLNFFKLNHIYLSVTRLYMTLLMVSPMAVSMILLMSHMYQNKRANRIIIFSGISVFILALVLLRTQTPINDVQYMKAMIPHHSSAILTSKRANIKDPEVKELSKQIIESQEAEIEQMKNVLKRIK